MVLAAQARTTLDIYLVDVEGGNATLFVAPSGESILIDTGNGGAAAARDGDRIMAAVKDAGLSQIDHLITTHYHGDHYGAMENVAGRIPIRDFIDHGPNVQPNPATDEFLQKVYPGLYGKSRHTVVKPGDRVAMKGVDVRVVASAGQSLTSALPGAGGANPYCAAYKAKDPDPGENAQSVGTHYTFGRFKAVHMGDLTWNKEHDLMCPSNRLGTVDLFVVSHHGQADLELRGTGARPSASRGDPEQRDAQGRTTGCDEGAVLVAEAGGPLADPFLAAERPGIHGARAVHRERG